MDNIYLTHHGIKGQKWGIRRFQQKDGSLTQAGRKRYGSSTYEAWVENRKKKAQERAKARAASEAAKREREEAKRKEKVANAYRKKSAGEMTDEELTSAINRARLEDAYRQLRPEQVSAGKAFAKKLLNEAVIPAAVTAGKNWLTKMSESLLKKVLPEEISELAALKNEKELLSLKKDIDDLRNPKARIDYDLEIKKAKLKKDEADAERTAYDLQKRKESDAKKEAAEAQKQAQKEAAEAQKQAQKEADDRADADAKVNATINAWNGSNKHTTGSSQSESASGMYNRTMNTKNQKKAFGPEDDEYTIVSDGDNKRNTSNTRTERPKTIYADYVVKDASSKSYSSVVNDTASISSGQSFVSGLLNRPVSGLLPSPKDDD